MSQRSDSVKKRSRCGIPLITPDPETPCARCIWLRAILLSPSFSAVISEAVVFPATTNYTLIDSQARSEVPCTAIPVGISCTDSIGVFSISTACQGDEFPHVNYGDACVATNMAPSENDPG